MLHDFNCSSPHLLFSPSGFHSEFKQVISRVITVEERPSIKKMCMCVYIYVYTYLCVSVCVCAHLHVPFPVCTCACLHMCVCLYVTMVCACVCVCVHGCVRAWVCVCVLVYQSLQCGWLRGAVCLSHKRERDQKGWSTSWTFNHTGTTWL